MADVNGAWNVVVNSPMGPQKSILTVVSEGDGFGGTFKGGMGTLPIENGKIEGDTLRWSMNMTSPFPLALDCNVTITGNVLDGVAAAGSFGSFPMKGERA